MRRLVAGWNTLYQLYNGTYNCAVTIKFRDVGDAPPNAWVSACIQVQGQSARCDRGNYRHYAGAVWQYGRGHCVRVSGGSGVGSGGDWRPPTPYKHCG